MGWLIRDGKVSPNPEDHTDQYRRHYERTMQDAPGPYCKLQGAAFTPSPIQLGRYVDEEMSQGRHLEELALERGDEISIEYDLGRAKKWVIKVESVELNKKVLPEIVLGYNNETRVKLLERGNGKPHVQYQY